jgi:iron complex outermembrane receptor protein
MKNRLPAAIALVAIGATSTAQAQGIATGQLIDSIVVTGARERAVIDVPNPTASKTAEDLREQNLVNPEDALKYLPNLTIRKRYIGDRNALIGGRSFSTLQAARGLVFMDDYLLSNFLGRFDAPRWNMIAPEEIERVDVLYGPFSAIYPGNSIGTTIAVRTRRPEEFELGVRTTAYSEHFDEYGLSDDYSGYQVSGYLADRFERGWFALSANRQDGTGHPMQYFAISANDAGQFPGVSGPAIPVTGVTFDRDPQGRRRAVFGASAGAIDHTVQNQAKLRGGYELGDALEIEGFVASWTNDSEAENRTFMRDAAGQPVWSGRVIADGIAFNVPLTALAPNMREEEHLQWGATLRTMREHGLNGSLVYSAYEIRDDSTLQASTPDPTAANGGPGTNTERDGTGWQTFEAQGTYSPTTGDWTGGAHQLAFGYHRNEYQLSNPVYATADWRSRAGTLVQNVFGKTRLQALYLQDQWQLADRWALTLGVRYEDWEAYDGGQRSGAAVADYADRADTAWSPKLSLAYAPNDRWNARLSVGRGVRFPTVSELFQGTATATSITVNDPNLQPETGDAIDLTVERWMEGGHVRLSLFQDDVRDSIFAQTNITVTPSVTNVQNVDRVRTRGVEAAFALAMPGYDALTFDGSVAYAKARILENDNYPVSVGNIWPRVPDWRASLQATWRPTSQWLASLGARYSGRMYNRLENDDINPDTYGGVSRYMIVDARVAYTTWNHLELALGVDNLTDEHAYQSHPYPARTGYVEARWSFGESP